MFKRGYVEVSMEEVSTDISKFIANEINDIMKIDKVNEYLDKYAPHHVRNSLIMELSILSLYLLSTTNFFCKIPKDLWYEICFQAITKLLNNRAGGDPELAKNLMDLFIQRSVEYTMLEKKRPCLDAHCL